MILSHCNLILSLPCFKIFQDFQLYFQIQTPYHTFLNPMVRVPQTIPHEHIWYPSCFGKIGFCWDTVTLAGLCTAYGCFHTRAEQLRQRVYGLQCLKDSLSIPLQEKFVDPVVFPTSFSTYLSITVLLQPCELCVLKGPSLFLPQGLCTYFPYAWNTVLSHRLPGNTVSLAQTELKCNLSETLSLPPHVKYTTIASHY